MDFRYLLLPLCFCFQSDGYRLLSGCRESVGRYSVCTVARIGFMVPSFLLLPEIIGTSGIWLALGLSEALTSVCILGYYLHERRKARS